MSKLRSLTLDNPMMAEARRLLRRYLDFTRPGPSKLLLISVGLAVVGVTMLAGFARFSDLVFLIMTFTCFLAPGLMHGAIAGERERRTWDFLLVAPVTHGQIVMGKFAGGAIGHVLFVLAWIPALLRAISRSDFDPFMGSGGLVYYPDGRRFEHFFVGLFFCIIFGWLLQAVTLFFSARARKSLTALGTTIGILFLGLFAFPRFVSSMSGRDDPLQFVLNALNPFSVIGAYLTPYLPYSEIDRAPAPWLMMGIYLAITGLILFWTERTLRFADNEVRFVPEKKHA